MHIVNAARHRPSPSPANPVLGWTDWPMHVGTLFKALVLAISAALVGTMPAAVLIVIFQERVVSGSTSGGIKG